MLIVKRVAAYLLDIILIGAYGFLLFQVTTLIQLNYEIETISMSPLTGQLIGLVTMTIPAFFYLILMENGKKHATIGKRLMGLRIEFSENGNPPLKAVLMRNLFKLIPWEIAHFGVHWVMHYVSINQDPPVWNYIVLIVPQIVVMIYFLSIFVNKENRTLYDVWSHTRVIDQQ